MQHTDPREFAPFNPIPQSLSPEDYISLLHPKDSLGGPAILTKLPDGGAKSWTYYKDTLLDQLPTFLDSPSFVSLNRFWGKRENNNLAAVNALFVDLDYRTAIDWRGKTPDEVQAAYSAHLAAHGLPQPSIVLQTGRGVAAIWLVQELSWTIKKRWRAALKALIELSLPFGADPACNDESRVFRIPGSINEKSGKRVRIAGGTLQRYSYETLEDQIYLACGRPTRAELLTRKEARKKRSPKNGADMPRGLTQAQRFRQIMDDLETFRNYCGGMVPVGRRNTWLHFYATCLTYAPDAGDIEAQIANMAAIATPGLKPNDVRATIRQALDKASRPTSHCVWKDGRYSYKGSTIAERLEISPQLARDLGLQQIVPVEERKHRKAVAERARRVAQGAVTRDEYLAENNASRTKPWLALGIGRTKFYELKKAGALAELTIA
ncbi:DNA-primase RepB domain-containing protein [Celeribacter sp. PS-C1]|uniref:DNA-primase RepB domain-containing protein n=1 Tax=Celeribacter sp. PS-C1 TaxID=2820813 RepID=UPI001CA5994F|nr:DNA-primase RepB domain-containing protein [Celeribacter sp. PS-C1]MBW6417022.1 RepB family DNA primase [Celeribacter sp. PS-C1]